MNCSGLTTVKENFHTSNNKRPSSDPRESQITKRSATVANNVLSTSKYNKFNNLSTPSISDKDTLGEELLKRHYENTLMINPNISEDMAVQMAFDSVTPDVIEQVRNDEIISKFYDQIVRFDQKISDAEAMNIAHCKTTDLQSIGLRNGLINLGNSCYLNTAVQLLAGMDLLASCLRNGTKRSPLKKPLFDLIDALKNPASSKERTNRLVEVFHNALMKSGWNSGDTAGTTRMNDPLELIGFLETEFDVEVSSVMSGFKHADYNVPNLLSGNLEPLFPNFMITMQFTDRAFTPPTAVTIGEDTYILTAVIRRPSNIHYVLLENGVTYNDSQVVPNDTNMSFARALIYTKVER